MIQMFKRREVRILMLGLDNAGKTSTYCSYYMTLIKYQDRRQFTNIFISHIIQT